MQSQPQQQQPASQQQQQQQPNLSFLAPAPNASGEGYDMSQLDQLQAHAIQLSASAGLTNLLLPNTMQQQQQQQQQGNGTQSFQQPQVQQQQQQAQQPQQQPQFLFLHPNQALQFAPKAQQPQQPHQQPHQQQLQQPTLADMNSLNLFLNGNNGNNQGLFGGQALAPAGSILVPANMQQQQQSYSTTGVPIPLPMLIPQQQQQPGQTTLAPLQPAPATTAQGRDTSVVSSSTISSEPNAAAANVPSMVVNGLAPASSLITSNNNAFGSTDNTDEFAEFKLRNKDGSIMKEPDFDKMTPAERRRYDRNLREQQRSFRISQQIQQLRDVLSESKVPFKPNKFSILVSVAEYIKQLQTRAIMLDAEHKKLFKTIQETNEMVQSGRVPDANSPGVAAAAANNSDNKNSDGEMLFVQGLDYQLVFDQSPCANGVSSIDGRIIACNSELATLMGIPPEQIERQSLFTLVQNHQEIFEAMAELLKRADGLSNGSVTGDPVQALYWSGDVRSPDDQALVMNITLACTNEGSPKFFSFALAPSESS